MEEATSTLREDFRVEQGNSRKNNLIIMGLQEAEEGSTDRDLVKTLFKDSLGITDVKMDLIYRLGKPGDTGPRPLLVKFPWILDRNKVWFSKSKLKKNQSRKIWFKEDQPKLVKEAQRTLYQSFKKAKSITGSFKSV